MKFKAAFWLIFFVFAAVVPLSSVAQQADTLLPAPDTVKVMADSLLIPAVSQGDTLKLSAPPRDKKKSAISSKVEYSATDSISLDLKSQKVYMYREADIKYEKIHQKAGFIEINFNDNMLRARPGVDSAGKPYGKPEFIEGDQSFSSEQIDYNFNTTKGLIKNVITKEGEGFLHGEVVKKMDNNVSNMRHGGYTTCNLDHPHFSIKFTKAKVIPNNKIVTGPAFLTIEDVPLPLVLPFGLFPNKRGQTSGIIIPTYGESANRGFYLENGGYYFGINDYMELRLVGDIYSRGSWAIKPLFNYRKRYKFNGSFNFSYAINTEGIRETESFKRNRDFRVAWTHSQDPRARPKSRFSANVNFVSSQYNRYNPTTTNDLLSNTFQSSISYQTTLFKDKISFSGALSHSQNTSTKLVNLSLPSISVSANRFYPLRKPGKTTNLKWYDNISMNYSMTARNDVSVIDSMLFKPAMFESFKNGMLHKIPISSNVKVMKFFTLSNSFDFTERWYTASLRKTWINDTLWDGEDYTVGYVKNDTVRGFKAGRDFGFTSSLSTTVYGLVQFKRSPIRAIRHVMRPSVSFSLRPDFGKPEFGYYKEVQVDSTGRMQRYSIFGDGSAWSSIYGSPPDGRSGRLSFSFSNNLEMKVRSKSDTVTGMKKVMLIESFSFGTSYDLAKDSLQWSLVNFSARTTLFKKLQIQYSSVWDPYVVTESGRRINEFEWNRNRRLLRRDNTSWNFSIDYNFASGKKNKAKPATTSAPPTDEAKQELAEFERNPQNYIDWSNPWNFGFRYNLNYTGRNMPATMTTKSEVIQTFGFTGDISITPKWKINMSSGYDFKQKKLSYTSVNIYRDLHCWEMRFNWIPIGYYKSWNFYIKVKASVLQDLKLNRKKDFRDN